MRPGDQLPSEAELAASYNVNRMTISKVMGALKSKGIVSRKQGSGTTVLRKPSPGKPSGVITVLPCKNITIFNNEYYRDLLFNISAVCAENDLTNTMIGTEGGSVAQEDMTAVRELFNPSLHLGLLMIGVSFDYADSWKSLSKGFSAPTVWIGGGGERFKDARCVCSDSYSAAVEMLKTLEKNDLKKTAFISMEINTFDRERRFLAFRDFQRKKRNCQGGNIFIAPNGSPEPGLRAAEKLLKSGETFDSLFFADQSLMEGFRKKIREEDKNSGAHKLPAVCFDYKFGGGFENVKATAEPQMKALCAGALELLKPLDSAQGNMAHTQIRYKISASDIPAIKKAESRI
jgi:DNA-binding LacI/PurR family transcriptional regulator